MEYTTPISVYAAIAHALSCPRTGCPCRRTMSRRAGLVHCPSHDDRHPSLSLTDRGGASRPLLHCHAGCSQRTVIAVLRERGLWS
jgi:hypothetical protein